MTGDSDSLDRQIESRVIGDEEVPEAFFDLQRRIAREQGHGDIEITHEMRRQLIESTQADQRGGLENWAEYLGGDDGSYPDWFKYYAWESVLKLGGFNKEKHQFEKRSRGTTAPYPELNREALAYVYDAIDARLSGEMHDDAEFAKLLETANFGKLYAYAVMDSENKLSPEAREGIIGSWKKFDQTSDPRVARRLSESLRGHGTGWCTAGESTAEMQLAGGDFYVYYSRDGDDKDTIPRIAIRMANGEVAEVRGIESNQNLEDVAVDIAAEKLMGLPGGAEYQQKVEDMRRLTAIDYAVQENPNIDLSPDDLRFLYEIDREIQGFGYDEDPRIDEILGYRDQKRDLACVFNCSPEQISLTKDEALNGSIVYHYGSLDLRNLTSAEGLTLPQTVGGYLYLNSLTSAEGLTLPQTVGGGLDLGNLTSAEGLTLPQTVGGYVSLGSLNDEDLAELCEKYPELDIV